MVDLNITIPKSFMKGEERCGYYVSEDRKKVWAVELDLLQLLLNVCKKYNIILWVDAGTMLGAVRHRGFIPWDDDIDVVLMRENYNKLCSVAKEEFCFPYFFQTEFTDPGSLRGHAQLRNSETTGMLESDYEHKRSFNQGIFIDIFPLDFVPDKGRDQYLKKLNDLNRKAHRYRNLTIRYSEGKNSGNIVKRAVKKCTHQILSIGGYKNRYFEKFEREVQKQDLTPQKYIGQLFWYPQRDNLIWETKYFESTVEFPFEMLTVPVPGGYEQILTQFYGRDWRNPKTEHTVHGGVIFDTDKSYIDYLTNEELLNH